MTELGQTERGVAELEAAAASSPVLPTFLVALVYGRAARADRALAIVDEQLARAERTGGHLGEQELHRLKGEAILRRDPSAAAQAEACFRRAIEIARGQSVKWASCARP
jgi:predicted ATPase